MRRVQPGMGQDKQSNYEKNKNVDVGHPSGLSPSDNGESPEELEGSEKAFRMKPNWNDRAEVRLEGDSDAVMGPGGDSRPDDAENPGFMSVEEHDTELNRDVPVHKENPEKLERTRVDQDDEIVARYDPVTGGEKAELRPRISKKGAESEQL